MRQLWIGLFIFCIGMGWLLPVRAQEAIPLELNKPIEGTLGAGENITYTFDIPVTQDVVITYDYEHLILNSYTVTTTTSETTTVETEADGGGGGDSSGTIFFIIPAYHLPEIETEEPQGISRHVELTLYRSRDTAADYTLTALTKTPRFMSVAGPMGITPEEGEDFQIIVIRHGLATPFTVEIEPVDDDGNGTFLWVANVPPKWLPYEIASEKLLIYPKFIDAGRLDNNTSPFQEMTLYYAGEDNFRLVIYATEPYMIYYLEQTYLPLIESEPQEVAVMYQIPVRFLQFDASDTDSVTLTARLVEGAGAFLALYEADNMRLPSLIALGNAEAASNTINPDEMSITVPIAVDGQMSVVVQIPGEFNQSRVVVELEWTSN